LIKHSNHIIITLLLLVYIQACKQPSTGLPDLKESYVYTDARPFGGSVAYQMVKEAYPEKTIEIGKKEFAENYGWHYDTSSVYINLSKNYFTSERDAQSLLDFVYRGNTAFISSENFDDSLMNKLYCKETYKYVDPSYENLQQASTKYTDKIALYKDSFSYFYLPFTHYFDSINSSYARVVGYNKDGKTNMFAFLWGKGRFYFQCEPRAFSNYFLLSNNNYKYMQQALQMLPAAPENIYWDNFYAKRNYASTGNSDGSTLSEIFKHPPLKAAFWIIIALLLLYILFNSKRRQRIVPIENPSENTSIAFAEAIAGLYLSKKDNKVIADKIITYFNEQVRTKYFLNINVNDSSYADVLSRKSGASYETTKELSNTIININASIKVSDEQLLSLNGQMERFMRKG
jgi:hypothetical protein